MSQPHIAKVPAGVSVLAMGGLFISVPNPPPVGTKLRLTFEVPGGNVQADAIVRNIVLGEGMGVEFTRLGLLDKERGHMLESARSYS